MPSCLSKCIISGLMTERAKKRSWVERLQTLGHMSSIKEDVQFYSWLPYPEDLYKFQLKRGQDPTQASFDAVRFGALMDRGRVFQTVGQDWLKLKVSDIPSYPLPLEAEFVTFLQLSPATIKFIAQETHLVRRSATSEQIKDWFLRTLNVLRLFPDGEGLVMKQGMDAKIEYPVEMGIANLIWQDGGLPTPILDRQYSAIHIPENA